MVEKVFDNQKKQKDRFNHRDTFLEHMRVDVMMPKRPIVEEDTGWRVIGKDGTTRKAKRGEVPKRIIVGVKPEDGIDEDVILADKLPESFRTKRSQRSRGAKKHDFG